MGKRTRVVTGVLYVILGVVIGMAGMVLSPQTFDSVSQWRLLGGLSLGRFNPGSERTNRVPGPADLVKLYPDVVIRQWSPETNSIAITFDDGPDDEYTPKILDILRDHGVRATFFLIGASAEKHPDIVKRIVAEGHTIGNHTYHHSNLANMAPWQVVMEMKKADTALSRITNERTIATRPPYGALDPLAVEALAREGYKVVLWTIDSLDWRGLPKAKILDNVIPELKSGTIVLHHSAGGPDEDLSGMLEALPTIIKTLQTQGYSFVTIPEVIEQYEAERKAAQAGQ